MIIAVRMSGLVGTRGTQESAMESLMLRKKYNCIILRNEDLPRINTIRELISFGEVDDSMLKLLLTKRGKKGNKPINNVDEVLNGLKSGKTLKEMGVNPFLKLHPPVGGFKKSTRLPYPQGVLAHNKEIASLVKRML